MPVISQEDVAVGNPTEECISEEITPMPLKYACFLSFRGIQREHYKRIVEQIYSGLTDELSYLLELEHGQPVYRDEKRLSTGDSIPAETQQALCESACMVLLYTPRYFASVNCALEYKAMEKLEDKRLSLLESHNEKKLRLIIPIVFRGSQDLPEEIRLNQKTIFMNDVSTSEVDRPKLVKVAEYIAERYRSLSKVELDLNASYKDFMFPSKEEIKTWLEHTHTPPFPGQV